jgi:hypothetical protein
MQDEGTGFVTSFGCYPSPPDPRDYRLAAFYPEAVSLPLEYHLRPKMTPVRWDSKDSAGGSDLSEQWLYDECKATDGAPDVPGTYIRAALAIVKKYGIPEEVFHRYEGVYPPRVESLPLADINSLKYRCQAYAGVIPCTYMDLQRAIYLSGPVLIAVKVYESFMHGEETGLIPMPYGDLMGGHALCATGWDSRGLEIKNSWSTAWGDGGYIHIPAGVWGAIGIEAWTMVDLPQQTRPWWRWL